MKQTLNASGITALLLADTGAAWTRDGAKALSEYLIGLDEDCGTETEFDRVGIRCDFSEHASLTAWAKEYGHEVDTDLDDNDRDEAIREFIQGRSELIEFDGGIILRDF